MNSSIIAIILVMGFMICLCVGSFARWYGFEVAELKFMPHLECDYLKDDLDYYERAQKEWVDRCLEIYVEKES